MRTKLILTKHIMSIYMIEIAQKTDRRWFNFMKIPRSRVASNIQSAAAAVMLLIKFGFCQSFQYNTWSAASYVIMLLVINFGSLKFRW